MGTGLNTQVANPFYGLVKTGTLSQPTVQQGQLLLPFPEYTGVSEGGGYVGNSSYHALQMKVERRFSHGGTVLAAYTFSKLLGDVASRTGWLDSGVGAAPGAQNPYNLRAEKSLAGFDSRQRLAISYAVDLPIGKDQKFLNGGNAAVQKFSFRLERERHDHLPGRLSAGLDGEPERHRVRLRPAAECGAWL